MQKELDCFGSVKLSEFQPFVTDQTYFLPGKQRVRAERKASTLRFSPKTNILPFLFANMLHRAFCSFIVIVFVLFHAC